MAKAIALAMREESLLPPGGPKAAGQRLPSVFAWGGRSLPDRPARAGQGNALPDPPETGAVL
ncbi:MAG: hypothetical protein MUF74_14250 [Cypionkella sp.]|nr:hypothetical protein [Cypionkella sp.]